MVSKLFGSQHGFSAYKNVEHRKGLLLVARRTRRYSRDDQDKDGASVDGILDGLLSTNPICRHFDASVAR